MFEIYDIVKSLTPIGWAVVILLVALIGISFILGVIWIIAKVSKKSSK
ncbi:MAG: hypothetical protein MUC29_03245 [Pyrinomonadaceae bacterium]|jgi:hypothetical protein|nr:hypothetical protein [Pyrinomonadaceae bacterium]